MKIYCGCTYRLCGTVEVCGNIAADFGGVKWKMRRYSKPVTAGNRRNREYLRTATAMGNVMMTVNVLPNEILDKIFWYCESEDILRWKDFEKMNRTTFLKKKDRCLVDAVKSGNLVGVKYLVNSGADILAIGDWALRYSVCFGDWEMVKYLRKTGAKRFFE